MTPAVTCEQGLGNGGEEELSVNRKQPNTKQMIIN